MRNVIVVLVATLLVGGFLPLTSGPVDAHPNEVVKCDFVTGGGWIHRPTPAPDGAKANFGVGGGCKNGELWGHLNYLDHGNTPDPAVVPPPFHVHWTSITGYFIVDPTFRVICGTAKTNHPFYPNVDFRVGVRDNGEPGRDDEFIIRLGSSGSVIYTTESDPDRTLGGSGPGGGNIQIHKDNPSTFGPEGSCAI